MPASLSFQNFQSEDGLSDNWIIHIFQDSRGFIWISTREGLNRFDGASFKKFYASKATSNFFPSNMIRDVCEYKKDWLLIATDAGLVTMNTVDQEFFSCRNKLLDTSVVYASLFADRNEIWLALKDGLIQLDSNLQIRKSFLNQPRIYDGTKNIHRLDDGRLVVVSNAGLFCVDMKTGLASPLQFGTSNIIQAKESIFSYYDRASNFLYSCKWNKELIRYDFNQNSQMNFPFFGTVRAVLRDSRGNCWIGCESGLVLYDEKSGRFRHYSHYTDERTSLVNDGVTFLFEDQEKNIWIGTPDGLSKLSSRSLSFTYYKRELAINGNYAEIYDITKGNDQRIYIATFGNGVFSIDSLQHVRNFEKNLVHFAWSVRSDGDEIIVTGHDKKISKLNVNTGKPQSIPILQPFRDTGDLVVFSYKDHNGGEWYSINKQMGLFYKKAGEKEFTHFWNKTNPKPFLHGYFSFAAEDQDQRIWFGMNRRSDFVCYDFQSGKFTTHELSSRTNHIAGIDCLLADGNTIWAGTNGTGLIRYDPVSSTSHVFTIENGLSSNTITSLVFDKAHRLWIGTSRGLSCLLPGETRFVSFTQSDGLPETNFNDGAIYYDSAANKLYAGAKSILMQFNPDEFLPSHFASRPALLDEILVNGRKFGFSSLKTVKLPYDQNNLQFIFTTIDFENSRNIHYSYMLQGADKDWSEAASQRSAAYTNLRHGSYRFLVKAIQPGNQMATQTVIPFDIIIQPPYWKTWWFRSLVGIAIISLLYALVRTYFLRKLERQRLVFEKQQAIEQERTRIATDMHDDLGSGLSRIKFLSQALGNKKTGDETLKMGLEKITDYSDEMTEKMGEIVWALNEKNDTLADLVAYTRTYAIEYLGNHQLNCEVNTPLNLPGTFIAGEIRRNIFLAVKECLHNIIKHANATTVYFSIQLDGCIEIIIEDNGKGIDWNNQRSFSNGLQNIRKRMNDIHGKVDFVIGRGTRVVLQAPLTL
jgi:signal transduction histidine kinase/ligand-binding sensor domain-containing protein